MWHAVFLALATNFMDVDTIIPAMLIKAGGTAVHLGLLSAIMIGGTKFFQLFFASYLAGKPIKKPFLISAINVRVLALLGLTSIFYFYETLPKEAIILLIFFSIAIFSLSGAFATVAYNDILGKSIVVEKRKNFFTLQQVIVSFGVFISAFVVKEILQLFEYPSNYGYLFIIAAILLGIASIGFWKIKEIYSEIKIRKTFKQYFISIPSEVKNNNNLKYYLILINSMGLGITLLPFLILFIKEKNELTDNMVGNFLIYRVIGMVGTSLLLLYFSQKREYKSVLGLSLVTMTILPLISIYLIDFPSLYFIIFLMSGIFYASYKIAFSGVLIEISNEDNRALYTGIAGAGNVISVIFPLIAGVLISMFGYTIIFITTSLIMLISLCFVNKLDCQTKTEQEYQEPDAIRKG